MPPEGFRPWNEYRRYPAEEMSSRAAAFADDLHRRRTVRAFSAEPVAEEVIRDCIRAAGSAPSGANKQPWHFAAVADPEVKRQIRKAAEVEEQAFYSGRAPQAWLDDLAPLGTDADKPFLETAPWLIVIFAERFEEDAEGGKHKNYYVSESVGIATGMLLSALHNAGLATLTHTPSPMAFLRDILEPAEERAAVSDRGRRLSRGRRDRSRHPAQIAGGDLELVAEGELSPGVG